jgi:hypothetical protein
MDTNSKPASPLELPDRIRAIADRLDEAFCASAGTSDCRALQPLDLLVMMETLADIADEVHANNEVMVCVASAYEACKTSVRKTPPARTKPKPRLSIVRSAVLVSEGGAA